VAVLIASNVAFAIVFGIFVLAMLVLAVVVMLWAIRRDRAGRANWLRRRQDGGSPSSNGHR
jgi:hypothetical protein